MNQAIVESSDGVTLVAGGPVARRDLKTALGFAPRLVAADGGADRALLAGHVPTAVIGDMDSVSEAAKRALGPGRLFPIAEQETTDFDKALRSIDAPFVLALGVLGGRVDHELAVFNALIRNRDRLCIAVGPTDVVFHAPAMLRLRLVVGDRVSLFPMAQVTGASEGLRWPIDGLRFAPFGTIGTSNEVAKFEVTLQMDGPGMLVILPRNRLRAALVGLRG